MYEALFYLNKNRTGNAPFKDSLHVTLCLQNAPSFGRSIINYNVKWVLEMLLEPKGKRTRKLENFKL